jgi:hypothetical protein
MEYLQETVYVDTTPVGTVREYMLIDEDETAKLLYQRLNHKKAPGQIKSITECAAIARNIREVQEGSLKEYLGEDYFFEMANISPEDSGLKTALHVWYGYASKKLPHGPRVKVTTINHGRLPIQLTPEVTLAVTKKLKKEDQVIVDTAIVYVASNVKLFLDHWNGDITDKELLTSLPKV